VATAFQSKVARSKRSQSNAYITTTPNAAGCPAACPILVVQWVFAAIATTAV
jgi:hypothetical protein